MKNSFNARTTLDVAGKKYEIHALDALAGKTDLARLPYSLKILLENLLRTEDGDGVTAADIESLAAWDGRADATEIAFTPARVLLQDFTGVPAVVDLAAMRDAMSALGGDPALINPLSPADLVIDHSLMVDHFGNSRALDLNAALEYRRNRERYAFLRWGQQAFDNFQVVPPSTGIVHQVNLEFLASVVFSTAHDGVLRAYPDTLVGADSHTTMINGLGVLGWGAGGIEVEAAMLGQPIVMLIPPVVGFELRGRLAEGATATDLVLTVTEMLRKKGVVGKFVEFFGDGLDSLSLADQATIANMAPEYGATCGIFPVDAETLNYLRLTGRSEEQIALVEAYTRRQGMFRETGAPAATYSETLTLDMNDVVPSIAGPKRPQDRIALSDAGAAITAATSALRAERGGSGDATAVPAAVTTVTGEDGGTFQLEDGAVVIAAITSCTNTSNPDVVMAAALLARNAVARGLGVAPWVKTSLAPGSQVVTAYLEQAGLLAPLRQLGFDVVGYGCTTCIGNSGPLPDAIGAAVRDNGLIVASVLSGNRNYEGRVHGDVRMNFLASPPLVVAYALAGTAKIDFYNQPIGRGADGGEVFLRDIWPSQREIFDAVRGTVNREMFKARYSDVFHGDARWRAMDTPQSGRFAWDAASTYVRSPPYFEGMTRQPPGIAGELSGMRALAVLGDSITTDHISPAGAIHPDTPAGKFLLEQGVARADFNSYGSRRGNHEVMMRGTFANLRLRNELAPGTEGGFTVHQPSGEVGAIYDIARRHADESTPLLVIAGREYGAGSSRDWAAKGPMLLGVRAVLVESFERIHRSNLIGMGLLPLQFADGEGRKSLGLSGREVFSIHGLAKGARTVTVTADDKKFTARVRIDTPKEWEYYRHGGILHYVLRQLAAGNRKAA